jgi:hypothetical protein
MKQLTNLPSDVCTWQIAEHFLSVSQSLLEKKDIPLEKNALVVAIVSYSIEIMILISTIKELVVSCGLSHPELADQVQVFLKGFVTQYFESPGSVYGEQAIQEYKTAINGLTQMAQR